MTLLVSVRCYGADQPAPIISAQAVRDLLPEEADRGFPVHLQGVVLYFNAKTGSELMIYDETAALYISGTAGHGYDLKAGDLVTVDGITNGGDFAPVVIASKVVVIGHGKLPIPRERIFSELSTGAEDGQWVKVSGIIRAAVIEKVDSDTRLSLELALDDGRLTVRVPGVGPLDCAALVDSEATVTGICFPVFNRKRQLLGIRLRAPALSHIQFTTPTKLATFDTPAEPINSLLKFRPGGSHRHRVKVQGVVTLQRPGENLVIRDDTQALWVKSKQTTKLQVGDMVEVLGFPVFGEYNPVLEDAVFRKRNHSSPLNPVVFTSAASVVGEQDGDLMKIIGTVLDSALTGAERILILRDGDQLFRARLPLLGNSSEIPSWAPGTRLKLTGVCKVEPAASSATPTFQLLLRSPSDIEIMQMPPWWTIRRVAITLGITLLVALGAIGWVVTLRRRVKMQTTEIQRKAEREAILEERSRIAREFHDTLEQELAGVLLQVQAARQHILPAAPSASNVLEVAESMLRHTQSEARSSIWDLRARALENGSLESALRTMAGYSGDGLPVTISVAVEGEPCPLPGRLQHHLLRIGQEATTNAIKHAKAGNIRLTLHYADESIRLSVEDDGTGFDMGENPSRPGHFGFLGMRERAEKIGGRFVVSSSAGTGTRIEVTVAIEEPVLESL